MTENDILSSIKEKMRAELSRIANEEIDKLVHKFTCELGKHKAELISTLINNIEIIVKENHFNRDVTFQINIKGGDQNAR